MMNTSDVTSAETLAGTSNTVLPSFVTRVHTQNIEKEMAEKPKNIITALDKTKSTSRKI
ncbi:hypothetical protein HW555_010001 [Spodoptera exigua]|uniref:Uncharacterized protein n=1 Tax=Spodoptera exigua TaxID=7107 RepID=A0A835GBC0_SPOEX|nr:hypothetical protein HW555_010001 [Spodoptera exigua]